MSLQAEAPAAPVLVVREADGVPVLELPEALEFEALRDWLDVQVPAAATTIAGRAGRLDIGARALDLFDLRRLLHHLQDAHDVTITGLYSTADAVHAFAQKELKLKLFVVDPTALDAPDRPDLDAEARQADAEPPAELAPADAAQQAQSPTLDLDPDSLREAEKVDANEADDYTDEVEPAEIDAAADPGRRTLVVHRTIRSGSAVRFDGDVTIFGDVNPGAQVTAAGSILVMGALKGVAHAGATGDEESFIIGLSLQPTQLRIGRRIAIASGDGSGGPEVAVVRGERIVIEPYRSRIPVRGA
jgi:septum site-determining protein MinC